MFKLSFIIIYLPRRIKNEKKKKRPRFVMGGGHIHKNMVSHYLRIVNAHAIIQSTENISKTLYMLVKH